MSIKTIKNKLKHNKRVYALATHLLKHVKQVAFILDPFFSCLSSISSVYHHQTNKKNASHTQRLNHQKLSLLLLDNTKNKSTKWWWCWILYLYGVLPTVLLCVLKYILYFLFRCEFTYLKVLKWKFFSQLFSYD